MAGNAFVFIVFALAAAGAFWTGVQWLGIGISVTLGALYLIGLGAQWVKKTESNDLNAQTPMGSPPA